jgi:hypothetical protein
MWTFFSAAAEEPKGYSRVQKCVKFVFHSNMQKMVLLIPIILVPGWGF